MKKFGKVTITKEGRDKGKAFLLTEMPAMQAERWALRLLLALAKAGIEVPEGEGMAALAQTSFSPLIFGKIDLKEAEVLLAEMMDCVEIIPDPKANLARKLYPDEIEEVATLFKIRMEVIALHTGFSFPAFPSTLNLLGDAGLSFQHV